MASTRLTDLLLPTSFSDYVVALTKEKSALIQSGVAVENPDAVRTLATGPRAFTLREYDDLDATDDLLLNDDPADTLVEADYDKIATVDDGGRELLLRAADRLHLTARGYHRVLRVARTIADLAGTDQIKRGHIGEAISFRRVTLERRS